jgi:LPS sulfotransferase NodH
MSGLIVCATQRSGSTLLCELLKATGVAGVPNEYFQHFKDTGLADQPRQYLAGVSDPAVLALLPPLDPGVPEPSFDFDAVRRAGTTPNGVFAAKIMWSHTPDLWARLGERTLEDVFGPLRYVQVVRRDKIAQAMSPKRQDYRSWRCSSTRRSKSARGAIRGASTREPAPAGSRA